MERFFSLHGTYFLFWYARTKNLDALFFLDSFPKDEINANQERIEQVAKTEFDWWLIEIVDGFLHGYGNYSSNLVTWSKTIFCSRERLVQL